MRNSVETGDKNIYNLKVMPNELVIACWDVILLSVKPLPLSSEFKQLFKKEKLIYGVNKVSFPIIKLSSQKSLNRFLKKYPQCILRTKTPEFRDIEWI